MTEKFGTLSNGEIVTETVISGGGLTAHVLSYGAIIRDLRLEGHDEPLVLGFDDLKSYETISPYFGAIVGRYANRIAGAQFTLDGKTHKVDANEGVNLLHGGAGGFSACNWSIEVRGPSFIQLMLESDDGDMGFPGNLVARCRYELLDHGVLAVTLMADCDAPSVCCMAQHSYFNLEDGGRGSIADHQLQIAAQSYLEVDEALIPADMPATVAGTEYDFRSLRAIGNVDLYDHNFCLSDKRGPMRSVCVLKAPHSGVQMEIVTGEPGLQLYTGQGLSGLKGLENRTYNKGAGLALETQVWPDAPNRPHFPSSVIRPGMPLVQETHYCFRRTH